MREYRLLKVKTQDPQYQDGRAHELAQEIKDRMGPEGVEVVDVINQFALSPALILVALNDVPEFPKDTKSIDLRGVTIEPYDMSQHEK